jgi:hypothetical protein
MILILGLSCRNISNYTVIAWSVFLTAKALKEDRIEGFKLMVAPGN